MDQKARDEQYMRLALDQAQQALWEDMLPVGAILADDEVVLCVGRKYAHKNFHLDHAEMDVLRAAEDIQAYFRGKDVTLYTTLEPCPMCFGALLNCRVPRIVYAMEDPYGGAAGIFRPDEASVPMRHKYEYPKIVGGVLREQARDLFRQYFQTTKNVFWREARNNPLVRACLV